MGLSNIKKKSQSLGKKSNASFLKINMYENPKMSLELISHICTSSSTIDIIPCFRNYGDVIRNLESDINKIVQKANNKEDQTFYVDFAFDNLFEIFYSIGYNVIEELLNNHQSILKIAVGGGYSAGKSSFLNAITGAGNLLPTGIEPVSIVNTNLNCSTSTKQLFVRGRNLKNEIIHLDKEVLECIQHSSKSKVYIASVLNDILIDIPINNQKYLDGITFIDTPGYNNSSNKNEENNTTDLETAKKAIEKADILFWCIDIDAGTISKNDLKFLNEAGEKPIVIIFTKSDKKPIDEIKKIVDSAFDVCKKNLNSSTPILDILAVSCIGNKPNLQYSLNKNTIEKLINTVKEEYDKTSFIQPYISQLNELFEIEIENSREKIEDLKKEKADVVECISIINEKNSDIKKGLDAWSDDLKGIIIDNYNEILECCDKRLDAYGFVYDLFVAASKREDLWRGKVGIFSDASQLITESDNDWKRFTNYVENLDLRYTYFEEKDRRECLKYFKDKNNKENEDNKKTLDGYYSWDEEVKIKSKIQKDFLRIMEGYKSEFVSELKTSYTEAVKMLERNFSQLKSLEHSYSSEIFSSISGDNYKRFLACFSNGIDLTICNNEGYNPITYAAKYGNNEMIRFFIENDVDFTIKDKNGYNALEIATIHHYRDICDMLLNHDNNLIYESQSLVELAKNDIFIKWISQI